MPVMYATGKVHEPERARFAPTVAGLAGALLELAGNAVAAPGDLDPTFGSGGRISLIPGGRQAQVHSVIQQADGRIVLAGLISDFDFTDSTQLLLVRLQPDGTLDTSFDSDGIVIGAHPHERAAVVIQQTDGKLVVAGRNTDTSNMVLWRFAPDGTPDASFGGSGSIVFALGGADYASGLVQQSSGKLVVAGTVSGSGGTWDRDMMMARFQADGQLDSSFGTTGTVVFHFARGAAESGHALIQQPDGKLLMTGNRDVAVRDSRGGTVALVRTTGEGELDTSFDGDGIQEIFLDFHSFEGSFVHTWQQSAARQDDGKIVVNGVVGASGHSSGFVFRLTSGGALDPVFGTGGIVFSRGNFLDAMVSVAIQADGKIVTAGAQNTWPREEMRLRRFLPDGRIDTVFGVDGTSIADFQDMVPNTSARAMARQVDGKLIVVGDGTSFPDDRPALAVARFVENGPDFAGLIGLLGGETHVAANEISADLIVRRTGGSTGPVSIAFETVDGSALAGADYVPQLGRLEWADGDSSEKSIALALIDDADDADDAPQQFGLRLFDPAGGAMLALQSATIWTGNLAKLALTLDGTTIGEAAGSVSLSVSRSGSASGAVSLDFETYAITAKAGADFTSAFGTLTWADGDATEKTITVLILDDGVSEADEWFGVSLSNPTAGAILGTYSSTTVTITEGNAPPPPPPPPTSTPPPPPTSTPPPTPGSTSSRSGGGGFGSSSLLLLGLAGLLRRAWTTRSHTRASPRRSRSTRSHSRRMS